MLVQRLLGARPAVVHHRLIQDTPVAGFFQVGGYTQDQPERVVVEVADVQIALEVGSVVLGIPQAELDVGENREAGGLLVPVGQGQLSDFRALSQRDEVPSLRFDPRPAGRCSIRRNPGGRCCSGSG